MYGETAYTAFAARNLLRNNQPTGAHLAPFYLAISRLVCCAQPTSAPRRAKVRHDAKVGRNAHGVEDLPAKGTNMSALNVLDAASPFAGVGRGIAADWPPVSGLPA